MKIENVIKSLIVKGNYAHKRKVYESLDTEDAFERFTKRIGKEAFLSADSSRREPDTFPKGINYRKYATIAASILLPVIIASAIWFANPTDNTLLIKDAKPGTSLAYIETSKGEVIVLNNDQFVINESGIKATATNGELAVESTDDIEQTTINIPRGGEYKLILPDGTKVHLNSDSRLTFPTRFTGDSRDVELVGEAYFEVSHSDDKPFIVHLDKVSVKQYGTHFNINAYKGKCKTITLIEGSIGVTSGKSLECRLSPGQQARINREDIQICNADVDAVMGWTEGMFKFDGERLGDIATILSRWYNVDINVDASLCDCCFTGSLSRESSLNDILSAICEITNTKISNNGNVVMIKK